MAKQESDRGAIVSWMIVVLVLLAACIFFGNRAEKQNFEASKTAGAGMSAANCPEGGSMVKIGDLPTMPATCVYRRASGETYMKLNEHYQVRVKLADAKDDTSAWLGNGDSEIIDPEELVEVI